MVKSQWRFLIDTAFVVERAHKAFFGAPLLTGEGRDHTFSFGCLRDFLRLRRKLGIAAGMLIIGKEADAASSRENVDDLIVILKELNIPHTYDPQNSGLELVTRISPPFSHIVTNDRRFLQFCADNLIVVLPRDDGHSEWDWMSSEAVRTVLSIAPKNVPTHLALTDPSSGASTSKQAIRLVELYGNVDSIYENLAQVASAQIRNALRERESRVRQCYAESRCERSMDSVPSTARNHCLNDLDTAKNRQVLQKYGFHSLSDLLSNVAEVRSDVSTSAPASETYHAVVDRKGLMAVESLIRASKLCSIDTESDDKDPRQGTLLGVSFSVKEGEAWFVPLIDSGLKGLSKNDVLKVLRRILNSDVDFIGHNIKYDCLLLRKSGIPIKSIYFDTMLAAFDCHGDWPFFNLPYVTKRLLGKQIESYSDVVDEGSSFLDVPFREMVNHGCQDADMTFRLYRVLLAQLEGRDITRQFLNETMGLLHRLAKLEFDGIAVDVGGIDKIRQRFVEQGTRLRSEICRMVGKVFDCEAEQELSEILREVPSLRGYIGPRRVTLSKLEQLAITEPGVRLIVEFKRVRRKVVRLESISGAARGGKIQPLFNQIKSRTGLVATNGPSLFDIDGLRELKSCIDGRVRDLFVDTRRALATLAQLTEDRLLLTAIAAKFKADPVMAKYPWMQELDYHDLLISLAVGQSDAVLSRRFLVERSKIAAMRYDLERRYQTMFRWLNDFRGMARTRGYATNGDLRKYIDGLKSSDIARRDQALEHAVRWLLHR
jgi:DNA polymerase I-like protein with 3'-5' exonuclease and polymerase domains